METEKKIERKKEIERKMESIIDDLIVDARLPFFDDELLLTKDLNSRRQIMIENYISLGNFLNLELLVRFYASFESLNSFTAEELASLIHNLVFLKSQSTNSVIIMAKTLNPDFYSYLNHNSKLKCDSINLNDSIIFSFCCYGNPKYFKFELNENELDQGFILAVEKANVKMAKFLCDKGAKITSHILCSVGKNLELLSYFFERIKTDNQNFQSIASNSFILACKNGWYENIKMHLNFNVDISELAFTSACENGKFKVVKVLINGKSFDLDEALIKASKNGHLKIVEFLLDNGANPINEDAFALACRFGDLEMAKLLYCRSYNSYDVNFLNKCLIISCKTNKIEIVRFLVNIGADVRYDNDLALRISSELGFYEIVRFLVIMQSDVNAFNGDALISACQNGHTKVVEFLLKNRANPTCMQNLAIEVACKNGHTEIVKLLIENGANINESIPSLLVISTKKNYYDIVQLLLSNRNHDKKFNNCSLCLALINGSYKIAKLILRNGSDINVAYYKYLEDLEFKGDQKAIEIFRKFPKPIDINRMSIVLACEEGKIEMVRLILRYDTRKMLNIDQALSICKNKMIENLLMDYRRLNRF